MRKLLLMLPLLLLTFHVHSQTEKAVRISTFKNKFQFTRSCTFDYDLEKSDVPVDASSTVGIDLDEDGTGRLFIYLTKKVIFDVEYCYYENNMYYLSLRNASGRKILARLAKENQIVVAFWLNNPDNNTAIVLFK